MKNKNEPKLLGGFGKINFGKQYRQGNRVYDSDHITMCLCASPVGNMGGYSYLYLIRMEVKKRKNLFVLIVKLGEMELIICNLLLKTEYMIAMVLRVQLLHQNFLCHYICCIRHQMGEKYDK